MLSCGGEDSGADGGGYNNENFIEVFRFYFVFPRKLNYKEIWAWLKSWIKAQEICATWLWNKYVLFFKLYLCWHKMLWNNANDTFQQSRHV